MFYKSQILVTYWLWRVITWLQLIYCKCLHIYPPFSFISWNHCSCIWCIKSIRRDSQNAAAAACYGRETRRTSHCKGTQERGAMFYQSAKNSPSLVKFYGFRKKKEHSWMSPVSAHLCSTHSAFLHHSKKWHAQLMANSRDGIKRKCVGNAAICRCEATVRSKSSVSDYLNNQNQVPWPRTWGKTWGGLHKENFTDLIAIFLECVTAVQIFSPVWNQLQQSGGSI